MGKDIIGDALKSIFTFWNSPKLEEFIEKTKSFKDLSMIRIGKCNNIDLFLINGDIVKVKLFDDFVEGGNDAVYGKKSGQVANFMPENQVWVDANIDINSIPYICFHEILERYLMDSHKSDYNDAHTIVNNIEVKLRKLKIFENRRKILQFPRIKQPDGSTCGHTSIAMILQYYGVNKNIEKIKDLAPTEENKNGLSPETILKIVSKLKLNAKIENKLSFDSIKEYINNDTPVIIELQSLEENKKQSNEKWEKEWTQGHYVVAIGYTLEYIIFADPQCFYKSYLKYDDMLPRWHDEDYGKNNKKLSIIIEKPNEKSFENEKIVPLP